MIDLLSANTVKIYYINTSNIKSRPKVDQVLNKEEYGRYKRYLADQGRTEFFWGRYLLKAVMSSYLNIHPQDIVFKKNQYGKLFLDSRFHQKAIGFNLTHSHGIVAGAFVLEHDIGIDVEKISRNISDIVSRFFSPEEKEYINRCYTSKKNLSYQIWTLKEAYIKAKGVGLSLPLESFSVFDDLGVFFYSKRLFFDYFLSLAIHNRENKQFRIELYDFNHLSPINSLKKKFF
jgi:4'-phosphopantetheinyl transferase